VNTEVSGEISPQKKWKDACTPADVMAIASIRADVLGEAEEEAKIPAALSQNVTAKALIESHAGSELRESMVCLIS